MFDRQGFSDDIYELLKLYRDIPEEAYGEVAGRLTVRETWLFARIRELAGIPVNKTGVLNVIANGAAPAAAAATAHGCPASAPR
jgi:hypothetical protein